MRTICKWYLRNRESIQPLILAIDEAQYLNYNILRDLKMLMNHSYDSLNCFSLILVGEPYLNHILDKQVHEALRQRITVHYNYEGLSDQEVPDYIFGAQQDQHCINAEIILAAANNQSLT